MISSKSKLNAFLAMTALATAASGQYSQSKPEVREITRKRSRNEAMAQKKRLVEQRLTAEQRQWNAAVEAKRVAKKARLK